MLSLHALNLFLLFSYLTLYCYMHLSRVIALRKRVPVVGYTSVWKASAAASNSVGNNIFTVPR